MSILLGNGDGTLRVDIGAHEVQSFLVTNTNDSGAGSWRQGILDANANRAGEALRVLEEYARFGLEDAGLSRTLKAMRHGLAELLADLLPRRLAARDTAGDVGTQISTAAENRRGNLHDVIVANSRRLQESLANV